MMYPTPYAAAIGRAGQIQQSSIVVGGQEPLTTEMLSQAPPQVCFKNKHVYQIFHQI